MKNIAKFIDTMYPPARRVLLIGLQIFALSLTVLAICIRTEMIEGARGFIHIYLPVFERTLFPLPILLFTTLSADLNQRKKKD